MDSFLFCNYEFKYCLGVLTMNIEAYDAESLRKLVRTLQKENLELKKKLIKANIPFDEENSFEEKIENIEKYDPDQGERIIEPSFITDDMAKKYFAMFWGRQDVYAKRARNGNYYPQCDNRWNNDLCPKQKGENKICDACENKKWTKLELWKVKEHLKGSKEDGTDAKLFLIKLQQDGKGHSTIKTVRGVLRPAFQMAMDDDILVKNPFQFASFCLILHSVTHYRKKCYIFESPKKCAKCGISRQSRREFIMIKVLFICHGNIT